MRARTVNEAQNFERGQNAKKAIGIGGLSLFDAYEERIDDLKKEIAMGKLSSDEEWEEYLRKTLVGKKITAEMKHLPGINTKTNKSTESKGTGEFTITVQDVKPGSELSEDLDRNFRVTPQIIVADMENNVYSLRLEEDEKIYFEE